MPTVRRILEAVRHDRDIFEAYIEDERGDAIIEAYVYPQCRWRVLEVCLDYELMPGFTVFSYGSYDQAWKASQ